MSSALTAEIAKFLKWSEQLPEAALTSGWEAGYEGWPALRAAAIDLVRSTDPESAGPQPREQVLYVLARDNVEQGMVMEVIEHPLWLHALARASLEYDDLDGRWQMAVALGASTDKSIAEPLLLILNGDADEYVSRMALLSLANIGSKQTEQLSLKAWKTNDEYQRIAALWALKRINSVHLPKFVEAAKKDGRAALLANLAKIE